MSSDSNLLERVESLRASLNELFEHADMLVRVLPEDPRQARAAVALLREMAERVRNDSNDLVAPVLSGLSQRQTEVLSLVARGFANKEIADVLRISERTVQFHLKAIFEKTNTDGRAEAAAFALRKGWIT
jgi:DNA-binding NarL/FixJ family response regulator